MRKERLSVWFLALVCASSLVIAGCAMFDSSAAKEEAQKPPEEGQPAADSASQAVNPQKLPEAEKLKLAEPILDALLKGMADENYSAYAENFTKGLKDNVTEKDFKYRTEKMKDEIGDFQSRTYLGTLNKNLFDVFLWKAKFSKHSDEQLMRLFLINDEGKYKVYMFNISPF